MFELVDNIPQSPVIKVIGVGGGGGNAVNHMVKSNIEGVEFICANTDAQALKNIGARTILQLGTGVTKGLGAGADQRLGDSRLYADRWPGRAQIRRTRGLHAARRAANAHAASGMPVSKNINPVSRWVAPIPGITPSLISGWANVALSAAKIMSHISASSQPPPKA